MAMMTEERKKKPQLLIGQKKKTLFLRSSDGFLCFIPPFFLFNSSIRFPFFLYLQTSGNRFAKLLSKYFEEKNHKLIDWMPHILMFALFLKYCWYMIATSLSTLLIRIPSHHYRCCVAFRHLLLSTVSPLSLSVV